MSIKKEQENETVNLRLDQAWHEIFEKYDLDKDGKISLDEFKILLAEKNNELSEDLPPEVLQEIVERIDWDKNKFITYNEFLRMIYSRDVCRNNPKIHLVIKNVVKLTVPKKERQIKIRRYFDEYKKFRFPWFIFTICFIEIAIFIYQWVMIGPFSLPSLTNNFLIYDPHKRRQIWRFLTYMFVHRDILHLTFNVIGQITVGLPLELVHGSWRVSIVFMLGVIYGSLFSAISDSQVYICGASGGVYALFTAHAANIIINFSEIDFAFLQLIWLFIVYALDLGQAVYHRINHTVKERPVAYVAHIFGAATGLLIGLVVLRNLKVQKWEQILSYVALALFVFGMVTGVVYNLMMTPPFDNKQW